MASRPLRACILLPLLATMGGCSGTIDADVGAEDAASDTVTSESGADVRPPVDARMDSTTAEASTDTIVRDSVADTARDAVVDVPVETGPPSCSPLGAQTQSSEPEFKAFLARCPRIAKWIYVGGSKIDFAELRAFKASCPASKTVLRMYGTPGNYANGDELWAARYSGSLAGATPADKAAVDFLESDNECDGVDFATRCTKSVESSKAYNTFLLSFVARAKKDGWRPLVMNTAVGNPDGDVETCAGDGSQKIGALVEAITAAGAAGGGWAYHGYTPTWSKDTTYQSYYALRYRRYLACFPALKSVPLVLTEGGFDKGGNPDADGYLANGGIAPYVDWLKWWQGELAKDPVVGVALFTFSPTGSWSSFRLNGMVTELASLIRCP
jgi:hypothetical protein